jgi:hypothetical protein
MFNLIIILMKNFFFVLLLAVSTVAFTAMDMQMATAPPPPEPVLAYENPYTSCTAIAVETEVKQASTTVQNSNLIIKSISVNPVAVKTVEKTHRARYDLSDCLSSIVIFKQGNAISTYDLRQKSTGLFHFDSTTDSPIYGRRCGLLS